MTFEEMKKLLKKEIKGERYEHSINVMTSAVELAQIWNCNIEKARIAGLLHDCAKNKNGDEAFVLCEKYNIDTNEISENQSHLLHGPIGSKIAKEVYKIDDKEILDAIACHSTGRENMTVLDKIIFLADFIEPTRNFSGVEKIRELSKTDLDEAVLYSLDILIMSLIDRKRTIHHDTINSRNYLLKNIESNSSKK